MAFVQVMAASDLAPGQGTVVNVGGKDLAVFNVSGQYYCIDNECPHRFGPLGAGELEGDIVLCPWHAWEFNVRTGESPYTPGCGVATFPCKEENGAVLVDI